MNPFFGAKWFSVIDPQAIVDNAEFVGSIGSTPKTIDCLGWDYAVIVGHFGATDVAMAQYSLWESDDNSTYTEISAADYSTAASLPSATADSTGQAWFVDLSKRKRYLRVEAIAGNGTNGTYLSVSGWLCKRMGEHPDTDAERGLGEAVFV